MGLGPGGAARLSLKNLRRRSAVPLLLALLVPSASVMVPLAMGASFEESLRRDIIEKLGPVDEIVRSAGVMRPGLFDDLAADPRLGDLTDGLAPALILPGILTGPSGELRDTRVDVIGIDGRASGFGAFADVKGGRPGLPIAPGEVYLGDDCARRLNVSTGDFLPAVIRDAAFSLESVYTPGAPTHNATLRVASVVGPTGLGGLRLVPRGPDRRTAYVDLDWLMEATGSGGMNAVLVSNNGDARAGLGGTAAVSARLAELLDGLVGLREGGFTLTAAQGYVKLENRNIFFNSRYGDLVRASDPRVSAVSVQTSYFVNMLMANGSHIAYSTVTALDPAADAPFGLFTDNETGLFTRGDLTDDEIILTSYAAGRLGVGVGEAVTLNYTVYDSAFRQELRYAGFKVRQVVELEGKADDPELMPPFPGIKGKASCGDWSPPVPIDRDIMVGEDLTYWQQHGGAPKAYISSEAGRRLWGNDLGNITTVKALPAAGVNATELARGLGEGLDAGLPPAEMGVLVDNVKRDNLDSVAGLFIVTEALLAFGSAVTASGMVLIYVVVVANLESRRREIGLLRSMGFSRRAVASLVTLEGLFLSLAGSGAGLLAGFAFSALGVWASNNVWTGVLPAENSLYPPGAGTLLAAFVAGFTVSLLSFYAGARSASRGSVAAGIRALPEETPAAGGAPGRRSVALVAGYVGFLAALLGAGLYLSSAAGALLLLHYFVFGDLLLLVTGYVVYRRLGAATEALSRRARLGRIALANASRNPRRSGAYIVAYALVVFPLLTLSAYLPVQQGDLERQSELRGGGYDLFAQSEVPVYFDLANASERAGRNITGFPEVSVVQFLAYGSPGGTCSNLNTRAPPRLLAANETFIAESGIPFSESADGSSGSRAWGLLDRDEGRGVVPVIGDYTTVVWIFEKGVGGTIPVTDESGRSVRLKIVAILHDSIFQGSVFVSGANLRLLYPTLSKYDTFLFKLPPGSAQRPAEVAAALEGSLAAFGLTALPVAELVSQFVAIDLAYVSMLQAMLASGLIIGTVGFSAKVSREMLERRYELGVMRALGLSRRRLEALVLGENLLVFLLGFLLALGSAAAASAIYLGDLPGPADTLAVLAILLLVITVSTLVPVGRFNAQPPAGVLRLPE
ncbi:MAG: FtsX-like permease family protein [Euryarchaeota archaeon]|nr:FtsX-like permease family protein [Euryarchaeota archaeon]